MASKDETRRKQHPVKVIAAPKIKMVPIPPRGRSEEEGGTHRGVDRGVETLPSYPRNKLSPE